VTSVRYKTHCSLFGGILLLVIGLVLSAGAGGSKIAGVLITVAALVLWGSPKVVVNTAGRDLSAAKGLPWTRGEAKSFVDALRTQLFSNTSV
jgi:hypothetical protein